MNHAGQDISRASASVGEMIRGLRTERGTSLRQFAIEVGISPATLSAMETGKTGISIERIRQIAEALQIHADQLINQGRESAAFGEGLPVSQHPSWSQESPNLHWRDFSPLEINVILESATEAFVRTGYHGASMRSIASLARLSVPGLYHHYRSKQDILLAVLTLTMEDLLWRVKAARNEGSNPVERIALVVESLALFHLLRHDMAFIGASEMRSLEPANRQRITQFRDEVQQVLDVEIESAIGNRGPEVPHTHTAGRAIATMCTSLPQWFKSGGVTTEQEMAVEYAAFALRILNLQPSI
jgi:AcrR family transcriptional regulator/DNA-binding XRE family transcriptional regulator